MVSGRVEAILIFVAINILLAWSVYLPLAVGEFFVAAPAFMAVAAYSSGLATIHGMPFLLALALSCPLSGVIAFLVGIPCLRLKGFATAIVTMAFFEMVRVFFLNFQPSGGSAGLRGIPMDTNLVVTYLIIGICLAAFSRLSRSRLMLAISAIETDNDASEAMGIDVKRFKLSIFAASGLLAGLAGVLYAHYTTYIEPGYFSFSLLLAAFTFAVVGGMTTCWGPIVGTVVLWLLPEFSRPLAGWRGVLYAVTLIVVFLLRPHGLLTRNMAKSLNPQSWLGTLRGHRSSSVGNRLK